MSNHVKYSKNSVRIVQGVEMRKETSAISSTFVATLVVGIFVGLVAIGLYYAYFGSTGLSAQCQSGSNSEICLSSIQLYSGSPSSISNSQNCTGDATLVVEGENLSNSTAFHLTSAVVYGGTLNGNVTTLVSVPPNSCLELSQTNPEIPPASYFTFVGYVTKGLLVDSSYKYSIAFDSGLEQNGTIIAQSE